MKRNKREPRQHWSCLLSCAVVALAVTPGLALADDDERDNSTSTFAITSATWDGGDDELTVRGNGTRDRTVTIYNAFDLDQRIDSTRVREDRYWRAREQLSVSETIPCRVLARQSDGQEAELNVANAPSTCGPKDGGASPTVPEPNQPPTANANGPYNGTAGAAVSFSSAGSNDPDGTITSHSWAFGDGATSAASGPSHTYAAAGTYTVTLTVTDNDGATGTAVTTVTIANDAPVACVETPGNGLQTHADCITAYTGPEVCVDCHEGEARDMHGSVHYQQKGPTDFVSNISGLAGERGLDAGETGINTYCGTHENSPRFTCAGCHVGNGRFPVSTVEFNGMDNAQQLEQLANIDCLTCHQEVYKRFPDPTLGFDDLVLENVADNNGVLVEAPGLSVTRTGLQGIPVVDPVTFDFDFVPADPDNPLLAGIPAALMSISGLEAAQTVHATTRNSCLNCHGGAGGGDGTKRGDLSSLMADPTPDIDQHMSPQGQDMTCADCHSAGNHRVRGRGLDLRPNDVSGQFTCDSCHGLSPHPSTTTGNRLNRHTDKVACQTCHIPTYAKGVNTEVSRDWQDPHVSQTACNGRGGWLPREDKAGDLQPNYAWFDGDSEVYFMGEPLDGVPTIPLASDVAQRFVGNFSAGDAAFVLGAPSAILASNGTIDMALGAGNNNAKIYPMKEHWGKLARHTDTNTLIGHSTFEFFRTGDFDFAVREGMAQTPGMSTSDGYTVVPVHTFQTINHGVEPSTNALDCGACHADQSGGPLRMDLQGEMGYELIEPAASNGLCNNCHGGESPRGLTSDHERSQHAGRACSDCHVRR